MPGSFHTGKRLRTVLPSAARTATVTTPDLTTENANYLRIRTKVTNVAASGSITPKVQRKNPDGTYTDVLVDAAITAASESLLEIGPGLPVTANASANALIKGPYRIVVTAANTDAVTYSVTAETF